MEKLNTNLSEEPVIISRETILESLRKSILDLGMMPEEKLKEIILDDNIDFVDALFIFQDFLQNNKILDYQINELLDDYSGKIKRINSCKEYPQDVLFILLYSCIMLYNDLANPNVKKKIKLNGFINMLKGCNINNNFPAEFLTNIYNKIYHKIKNENIINNKLHNEKIIYDKKSSCVIL